MKFLFLTLAFSVLSVAASAQEIVPKSTTAGDVESSNLMDDLNPFSPDIEKQLDAIDAEYAKTTGSPAFFDSGFELFSGCYRSACAVWAHVVRSEQTMYLYENGNLIGTYATSTGTVGFETPNFDRNPNGRIYDKYTSTKYPEGDYNGLGNMPYAVFIEGGFAIHGTSRGNWKKLGQPASHGCIRIHPDNAYKFNRLVRQYGRVRTWITVE